MSFVVHHLGQGEQLCTELQASSIRRVSVNHKSYMVVLDSELDGSARRCKTICLPNEQYICSSQAFENFRYVYSFGSTNENHLAAPSVCVALQSLNRKMSASNHLSLQLVIEKMSERILSKNTDREERLRTCKAIGRPVNKLREVKQESRLKLVLAGKIGLCPSHRRQAEHDGRYENHPDDLLASALPQPG